MTFDERDFAIHFLVYVVVAHSADSLALCDLVLSDSVLELCIQAVAMRVNSWAGLRRLG